MVWLFSLNLNCGLILHMLLTYVVSNCFLWFKNSAFKFRKFAWYTYFDLLRNIYICISNWIFSQCSKMRKLLFWNKATFLFLGPSCLYKCFFFSSTVGNILCCTCNFRIICFLHFPSGNTLLKMCHLFHSSSALKEKGVWVSSGFSSLEPTSGTLSPPPLDYTAIAASVAKELTTHSSVGRNLEQLGKNQSSNF